MFAKGMFAKDDGGKNICNGTFARERSQWNIRKGMLVRECSQEATFSATEQHTRIHVPINKHAHYNSLATTRSHTIANATGTVYYKNSGGGITLRTLK